MGSEEKIEEKRERYIPAPGTYEPAITLKNVSISYTTMQKTSIKQMLRRKKRPQKETDPSRGTNAKIQKGAIIWDCLTKNTAIYAARR